MHATRINPTREQRGMHDGAFNSKVSQISQGSQFNQTIQSINSVVKALVSIIKILVHVQSFAFATDEDSSSTTQKTIAKLVGG